MAYNYALHLLKIELEKQEKERDFNEKWFAEKGGRDTYRKYCQNVDYIESLEAAIKILEDNRNDQSCKY